MTAALAHVTRTTQGERVSQVMTLYVATPAVLGVYAIRPGQVNPSSGIVSSRPDLDGLQLFGPRLLDQTATPTLQTFAQLPAYGSAPATLITPRAMQAIGLQALPAAWLLQTTHSLTTGQIATAEKAAATAGLYVETRTKQQSSAPLRNWSTTAGILLALGVLGMTVGLIRSETANDLRTLTATGATSRTRRTLTGATAGALGLLGALLGTAGAYAGLSAWHRSNLNVLTNVPTVNLVVILVGLPVIAFVGGWVLGGRQPSAIAHSPLE
jgi:putative ABC transport system permease protein